MSEPKDLSAGNKFIWISRLPLTNQEQAEKKTFVTDKPSASHKVLTNEGINDMTLFHLRFRDGSVIGTSHFDEPRCSHYWNSVFRQITKDLFLLAKDGHL